MPPNRTIGSKGRITVPIEIRRHLGLHQGDRLEFVVEEKWAIIRPIQTSKNPFEKYAGILPAFSSEREMKVWLSSLRDEKTEDR
jgi:AbrB family looped-hinge helix DNA binding protein